MKDLTPKQAAIMEMIVEGLKPKEIVRRTGMAPGTLQTHLWRAKVKLGAVTVTQAAVLFDRSRRGMA